MARELVPTIRFELMTSPLPRVRSTTGAMWANFGIDRVAEEQGLERVMGIEPTLSAWKAEVLPLNYTRMDAF